MSIISEKAIILRKYSLYDFDEILLLFGSTYGLFKATSKRSRKNNSTFFGKTGIFTEGIFVLNFNGYDNLSRIKEISILNRFQITDKGVQNFYILSFFSELILKSIFEKNSFSLKIFSLFERILSFKKLNSFEKKSIALYVIYWIMKMEGILPSFNKCLICGRKIENDIVLKDDLIPICTKCGDGKKIEKNFFNHFSLPPEKFLTVDIKEKDLNYLLNILILKFENFANKKLNSKELLFS